MAIESVYRTDSPNFVGNCFIRISWWWLTHTWHPGKRELDDELSLNEGKKGWPFSLGSWSKVQGLQQDEGWAPFPDKDYNLPSKDLWDFGWLWDSTHLVSNLPHCIPSKIHGIFQCLCWLIYFVGLYKLPDPSVVKEMNHHHLDQSHHFRHIR